MKSQIREVLGDVPFFDGAAGTSRQLRHLLEHGGLLNDSDRAGTVTFRSSKKAEGELDFYQWLFQQEI